MRLQDSFAPFTNSLCYTKRDDNVVFMDDECVAELQARASELGYAQSAFRLDEYYECRKMGYPQDPALSIYYYVRPFSSPLIPSIKISRLSKIAETCASP